MNDSRLLLQEFHTLLTEYGEKWFMTTDMYRKSLIRRVEAELSPPESAECEACAAWNLICPRCGAPKGGECGWPTSCPTGQNRSNAALDSEGEKK